MIINNCIYCETALLHSMYRVTRCSGCDALYNFFPFSQGRFFVIKHSNKKDYLYKLYVPQNRVYILGKSKNNISPYYTKILIKDFKVDCSYKDVPDLVEKLIKLKLFS